ncbi:nucleotide pyrophosphohydrolase [Desulfitobacterium hafniense]|uniref:nucleotide pyrophosphohydrolase n=1 Tax=Desulfitobacterium hafniense TaxID=49338 RepID=UPI00037B352F|nr:nucleotide pyrophosphohydrolase [Desulfitobacterium hafniense]
MKITEKNTLQFHRLNGLTPTVESCTMKLIEELGELLQLIGKGQGSSGERVKLQPELEAWETLESRMIDEAFDVAQSAVTMIFTLCEKMGYYPQLWEQAHEHKLRGKGYLVEGKTDEKERMEKEPKKTCSRCKNNVLTTEGLKQMSKDPCLGCGITYSKWAPREG